MDDADLTCTTASHGRTAHFSDTEVYVMYVLLRELANGEGDTAAAAREMAERVKPRISKFFQWAV